MVAEFVEQWEARYQDKYLFEPAEGAQVANLIKKHPHLVERWPAMVERYLASAFWASKRHPLMILVTRPVEFAGDANAPIPQKWSDSRRAAINWAHRKEAAE